MAIQAPYAKEDLQAINATENAISAVTKVCKYVDTGVPLDNILPLWLSWLPVIEDKEEAPHVYNYLCDLIERFVGRSYDLREIVLTISLSPPPLFDLSHPSLSTSFLLSPYTCTHSNSSVILGQNNGNVPRILGIIADVCAEDALQDAEQVYMRLLAIARHIQVFNAFVPR